MTIFFLYKLYFLIDFNGTPLQEDSSSIWSHALVNDARETANLLSFGFNHEFFPVISDKEL